MFPTVLFFRAAAFVRAKRSVPSYQQDEYELQHWSMCEHAYLTRTPTPPDLLTIHHSTRAHGYISFVALGRSNFEKKLPASSFLVCPSSYKQRTRLPPKGFSWKRILVICTKFEDESKLPLKSDNNNRHFTCSITYTWLLWSETSPQLPWLPILHYLLRLPTFLGLCGYAKAQESSMLWTDSNLFLTAL